MIAAPSTAPPNSTFFVTRRPDIFWEQCAPCEEMIAGPFDDQEEAIRMVPVVRRWMQRVLPDEAQVQFGVLRLGPVTLAGMGQVEPRLRRDPEHGFVVQSATRLTADWIRTHATDRREPLDQPSAPGFGPQGA